MDSEDHFGPTPKGSHIKVEMRLDNNTRKNERIKMKES
jgi:hypothetical protein